MKNLTSARLIHAKGIMFLAIGIVSVGLLLAEAPTFRTAALLILTIWGFCRFYYYLFYVLERYLGRDRPFAGVMDAMRWLITGK